MGVIHKLRQEVVEYIFQQKKDNPSISCRELSKTTSEKFQVTISKSSINTILKSAQLSSPVGRRNLPGSQTRKFKIPSEKKKELFSHPQPVVTEIREMVTPDEQVELKKELDKLLVSENAEEERISLLPDPLGQIKSPEPKKTLTFEDTIKKPQPHQVESDFINEEFHEYIRQLRSQKKINKSQMLDGMGLIFLKAAEWEISKSSILAGLFNRYISGIFPLHMESSCEVLLYLELMKIRTTAELNSLSNSAIWILNGLRDQREIELLLGWVKTILEERNLAMEFWHEQRLAAQKAYYFKVSLESGKEFCMDTMMAGYSVVPMIEPALSAPLYQALSMLSKYFISNVNDALFYPSSSKEDFLKNFKFMADVFDPAAQEKITHVSVHDGSQEEIASFDVIPKKKRTFVIGLDPQNDLWEGLASGRPREAMRSFYSLWLDSTLFYSEAMVSSDFEYIVREGQSFRIIFLHRDLTSVPLMILVTNNIKSPAEDIIAEYFMRWPDLAAVFSSGTSKELYSVDGGEQILNKANPVAGNDFSSASSATLAAAKQGFLELLNQHCLQYFFKITGAGDDLFSMKTRYYDVPGKFIRSDKVLNIHLCPSEGYKHIESLKRAIYFVNRRDVHDPAGRKLLVELT